MKLTFKSFIALLISLTVIFGATSLILAQDDEDIISADTVEKTDNSQELSADTVEAAPVEKPTAAPVKAAPKQVTVDKIIPTDLPDKVKVMVITSEKVKFKATELEPPPSPRILLQLSSCKVSGQTINFGKGGVDKVRSAQHDSVAWVVIDMASKGKWTASQEGNKIIIDIPKTPGQKETAKEEPASPPVDTKGRMMYRVIDISSRDVTAKKSRVIITADGPAKYRVKKSADEKKIILTVVDAVSIVKSSNIAAPSQDSPMTSVNVQESGSSKTVEVSISLKENSPYTVSRDQNQIVVDIDRVGALSKKDKKLDLYQKVSVNIQTATLGSVLSLLAKQTGFEFNINQGASLLVVTIREENQPLEKVLSDLLTPNALFYEVDGNILKIGTVADLKAEKRMLPKITKFYYPKTMKSAQLLELLTVLIAQDPVIDIATKVDTAQGNDRLMLVGTAKDIIRAQEMIASIDGNGSFENTEFESGLKTRVFKLQYTTPTNILTTVTALLSGDGKINVDERSGSLIITDNISTLKKIEKVISKLDTKLSQVMIEARLYEVNVNAAKNLGIRWSADGQSTQPHILGEVTANPMVGIGTLTMGMIQSGFKINAIFDALESKSDATLLSSPKITVENNNTAQITTSRKTYYITTEIQQQTGAPPVVSEKFNEIDLPINLMVAPKITEDGTINMKVIVTVSKVLGTSVSGGPPDTSQQSATTQVTARNNETIVIGGLITERVTTVEEKVPLLGDIPLLGNLFKGTKTSKDTVELVVFLTPSIVED